MKREPVTVQLATSFVQLRVVSSTGYLSPGSLVFYAVNMVPSLGGGREIFPSCDASFWTGWQWTIVIGICSQVPRPVVYLLGHLDVVEMMRSPHVYGGGGRDQERGLAFLY